MIKFNRDEQYNEEDAFKHNEEFERREQEGGQPTPQKGERKRSEKKIINSVPVDRDTWNILVQLANLSGEHLHAWCGTVLSEVARDPSKLLESPIYRVTNLQHRAKIYFGKLEAIELTIAEYLQHPTEEIADNIGLQCDELGVDMDEIMKKVKSGPITEILSSYQSDPDTKTGKCRAWLKRYMKENNYQVLARQGNLVGNGLGFHRDMIALVRKQLGIVSSLRDSEYVWEWNHPARAARLILSGDDLT